MQKISSKINSDANIFTKLKNRFEKNNETSKVKKEESGREEWSSGLDFFLSALGYAVGVGNVWRFPYLTYKNGGGVFLIPYFLFMFIIGIPIVYLEFTVGQFTSKGPLSSWKMVRISKGM
jgi:SNF family Na+-dependent transporter